MTTTPSPTPPLTRIDCGAGKPIGICPACGKGHGYKIPLDHPSQREFAAFVARLGPVRPSAQRDLIALAIDLETIATTIHLNLSTPCKTTP